MGVRLGRLAVFAAVAAATLCVQLPFFDRWFSGMDEGHILLFSEIAAEGGTLYRDATFYPLPGAFYLLAGLFRLFEPSILVARWAVSVEFALFTAVIFDLMRRAVSLRFAVWIVPLLWAYRVWAFPHWQMYNYSTTALLLYAVSLRLLLAHLETPRRWLLAAAGLVFGIGVFCKQDYGAAVLLASVVTLAVAARTRRDPAHTPGFARSLATFLLPAAGVGLLAGLHFLERGVLPDVIRFCVTNHFTGMSDFEYPSFPSLWPLFSPDPKLRSVIGNSSHFPAIVRVVDYTTYIKDSDWFRNTPVFELYVKGLIYGPWLVIAAGALRLRRTRARLREPAARGPALAELVLWSVAAALMLLVHVVKPQDTTHLFVLTWPFFCLALVYAAALARARPRLALAAGALLLPLALVTFAYTARLAWLLRDRFPDEIQTPRGHGIYVRETEAKLLGELVELAQAETRPDQTLAVFPYYPMLNFLADRRGPHRAGYILWPYPEIADRDLLVARALEQQNTPLVILHNRQIRQLGRAERYAPLLYAYLINRYTTFRLFDAENAQNAYVAMRRNPGEPGRPLFKGLADTRLRIEHTGSTRELNPIERDALSGIATWYFRRTVALRPTSDGRSVLSVPFQPQPGERLRTAVGVHPDLWYRPPASQVSFRIEVVCGPERKQVYERTLDPRRAEDRQWFEVDLPLDEWVDRKDAVLELSTEASTPDGELRQLGGFALPRLLPRASRAPASPSSGGASS
jgi:hypothetical protein